MVSIYQLRITLQWIDPPIWRRILVPGDITLAKLHHVIQTVMGWENLHLHQFRLGEEIYGGPELTGDDFYDPPVKDESKATLNQVAPVKGNSFFYEYDFGDSWIHEVVVEIIIDPDPDQIYPICLDGKRACPPEDCGGPPGYEEMFEALTDPKHHEHREFLEWIGDDSYDPEVFNPKLINAILKEII